MNIIRNTSAIFLLTCMFISCKKESTDFQVSNMENKVLALGHGGMGISNFYPMNSYESMINCLNIGADGTELDVQMTKDSVLVSYHDEMLETLTNGTGRIIDYTWEELQEITYQAAPYISYDIASIDTLFSNVDHLNQLTFSFDNKLYFDQDNQDVFIRAVIRLLEHYNMEESVFIESHNPNFLSNFKDIKDYKFFLNPDNFEDGLVQVEQLGLYGIIMDDENITADQITQAHQHGIYVQTWGPVSKEANIEAIQKNPDAIQTNNINALVDLLK